MTELLDDLQGAWETTEESKSTGGAGKFEGTIVEAGVQSNDKGNSVMYAFTKPGLEFPLRKYIPIKPTTIGMIKKELRTLELDVPKELPKLHEELQKAVGLVVPITAVANKDGRKNAKGYVILNYYFGKPLRKDRVMAEANAIFGGLDTGEDDLLS